MNYQIDNDGNGEIWIDGAIVLEDDWWSMGNVVARDYVRALSRMRDVVVHINSTGGNVFAGAAIYTALRGHDAGTVTVHIDGLAASIASVIAMAGDRVLISPMGSILIHDPWTDTTGNARDMDAAATMLREIGESIVGAYAAKTGKPSDVIRDMMAAETIMNAQSALENGFADEIMFSGEDDPQRAQPSAMTRSRAASSSAVMDAIRPKFAAADKQSPVLDGESAAKRTILEKMGILKKIYERV